MLKTLDAEVVTLNELYEPLKRRLEGDKRLQPLTFDVSRQVDRAGWVAAGTRIFDLRRPPFRGRGELLDAAERALGSAWRFGIAAEVRVALAKFISDHLKDPASVLRQGATVLDLGQWLFSDRPHLDPIRDQVRGTRHRELVSGSTRCRAADALSRDQRSR